jgi:hypothetical protein
MPATLSYPGVYIEEVPSGVRTITGVATSITAFIGRAVKGATDDPVIINSYGDFERAFGPLHVDYPMSYAVRDFYQNGGGKAVIVRLYKKAAPSDNDKAAIKITNLNLAAVSAGTWGNALRARIEVVNPASAPEIAARLGVATTDLFNLRIKDTASGGAEEIIFNLTTKESARRADRVLAAESQLMRVTTTLPNATSPTAHTAAAAGKTIWDDDNASSKVAAADLGKDSAALTAKADWTGSEANKTGLYALKKTDLFNLLCIPPDTRSGDTLADVYKEALTFCVSSRALLIVDAPTTWTSANAIVATNNKLLNDMGLNGEAARNAALYFPRVQARDPLRDGQVDTFVPCGIVAGVMARTDERRGVWKAPAGIDAALSGPIGPAISLTDGENGMLNPLGINCLRSFPVTGSVVWGSRTLRGADLLGDEYKYVPVRRLALFIEETLFRGTKWVVFEPNDEPLWAQIRLNLGAFMNSLFRQGAFQGTTPREAYLVKCDRETTTQDDINRGVVNILVGFAPLKPAEFVVIKIQQLAGQIQA